MRHKLSHAREDGEFSCNICVKTFTEALTLRSHQRMHSGEKPCICKICEKSFTNSASLTNHKRMHTGETSFGCKLCKKSFTQSIDLKDHQSVHGSRYFCNECDKYFSRRRALEKHARSHIKEEIAKSE